MVSSTVTEVSPLIIDQIDALMDRPWVVILFNDDFHTFDEVVLQLQKATGCSVEDAERVTLEAHSTGRAIAFEGPVEECCRVQKVLESIRLQATVDRIV